MNNHLKTVTVEFEDDLEICFAMGKPPHAPPKIFFRVKCSCVLCV
jgi:hypothetical protein